MGRRRSRDRAGVAQLGLGTNTSIRSWRQICEGTVSQIKDGITALVKELMLADQRWECCRDWGGESKDLERSAGRRLK